MSHSSTVMAGALKPRLRHMSKRELPDGLQTNPRGRWLDGVDDPPEGRLRERVGWVAEVQGRVAGSMVYDVVRSTTAPQDAGSQRCLLEVLRRFLGRHEARPLHVELLDVTVGPSPYWEAVERTLLDHWVEELQCSCGRASVVLPESNLAVQLFLRNAGYRAVRVLQGYYGDEDGYLMTRGAP